MSKPDRFEDEHDCECAHCRADEERARRYWDSFVRQQLERPIVWPSGSKLPIEVDHGRKK